MSIRGRVGRHSRERGRYWQNSQDDQEDSDCPSVAGGSFIVSLDDIVVRSQIRAAGRLFE